MVQAVLQGRNTYKIKALIERALGLRGKIAIIDKTFVNTTVLSFIGWNFLKLRRVDVTFANGLQQTRRWPV